MPEETPNSPIETTTVPAAMLSTEESSGAQTVVTGILGGSSPNESESQPVIAPQPTTASPAPIEATHETLSQELKELVTLTEDEIKRIVAWAQEKWKAAKARL